MLDPGVGADLAALARPREQGEERLPARAHDTVGVDLRKGGAALELAEHAREDATEDGVGELLGAARLPRGCRHSRRDGLCPHVSR